MYVAPEKIRVDFSAMDMIAGEGGGEGGSQGGTFPGMGGTPTVS